MRIGGKKISLDTLYGVLLMELHVGHNLFRDQTVLIFWRYQVLQKSSVVLVEWEELAGASGDFSAAGGGLAWEALTDVRSPIWDSNKLCRHKPTNHPLSLPSFTYLFLRLNPEIFERLKDLEVVPMFQRYIFNLVLHSKWSNKHTQTITLHHSRQSS